MKNLSVNKIFLDKVQFHCQDPKVLRVTDLNVQDIHKQQDGQLMQPSLFEDTLVFNPSEVRQYLFAINYMDPALKVNKFEQHHLG
jgi:hypothetical protein